MSSLVDNTYIMGLMNEIVSTFDHLLTQLALVGLRAKISKCKLWSPSGILSNIKIPQGYTLVINGLCIFSVPMGS
jgi:hypothetical protein